VIGIIFHLSCSQCSITIKITGTPRVGGPGKTDSFSVENLETVIKATISHPAFYYHHASAILNSVSCKILLPGKKKCCFDPSSKKLLL
jgi:hypothetical protein